MYVQMYIEVTFVYYARHISIGYAKRKAHGTRRRMRWIPIYVYPVMEYRM